MSSRKRTVRDADKKKEDAKRQHVATKPGRVFVGRYDSRSVPKTTDQIEVVILHTSSKGYGKLSPFNLKDENGRLIINDCEFSKVFDFVLEQRQLLNKKIPKSPWRWQHHEEKHWVSGMVTTDYWTWREKGLNNHFPVMWPNGPAHSGKHIGYMVETTASDNAITCIHPTTGVPYKFIKRLEGRKQVLAKLYRRLCPTHPVFLALMDILRSGKDILILEQDGPKTFWYVNTPLEPAISPHNSLLISRKETIDYLINDHKHGFGHGYVIAALLNDPAGSWLD